MASPDNAATDQSRDLTDVKAALVTGICAVALTLPLEYGAGIEVPLVYRLLSLAPYFAYAPSHGATLSVRMWMVLIVVVTFDTFGFFVF